LKLGFDEVIEPMVEAAKTSKDYDQIVQTIGTMLSWGHFVGLFIAVIGDDNLHDELAYINQAFDDLVVHAVEIASKECKDAHNFSRILTLFAYERTIQLLGIGEKIRECLQFELRFHSIITEGGFGDPYGYRYELRSTVLLATGDDFVSGRLVGSAPLNYISVSWIGSDGCAFDSSGESSTFNALDGINGIPYPFAADNHEVVLTYDPGLPAENVTMSCPDVDPIGWHTAAWKQYFDEMHSKEKVESSYRTSTPLLNGETIAKWTYHNTTTGSGGQAVIEDTTIELVHQPQP
jgi:hypothetical protein